MAKNDENGEYKFVIAILAGTISFLYTSFSYIQNTAINAFEYLSLCALISLALIILIVYFIYFIFKGFSMELKGENHEQIKNIASKIYLINFFICATFLIILVVVLVIINSIVLFKNSLLFYTLMTISLTVFVLISIYCMSSKFQIDGDLDNFMIGALNITLTKILLIFAFIFILWVILFIFIGVQSHQGNIEFDMDKIYYKNDKQIPVLMKITGPDTYFTIGLYHDNSNDLIQIWNIRNLGPNYFKDLKTTNFISSDSAVASSLGSGKYNIFINTTNLTTGYYQIKCSRQSYGKDSYEYGFYLLDYKNESLNKIDKLKDESNLTI